MHIRIHHLLALLALAACDHAMAQKAGSFSASIGVTNLAPSVSSGNLTAPSLPGTQATINENTQLTANLSYMLSDNWAVAVPLGYGFKHDVTGTGAIAGAGVIATTKALPITVLLQYHFMDPGNAWRPYVGAGYTYAKLYDTQGTATLTALTNPGGAATTASFESKSAVTLQLGVLINVKDRWFVDLAYTKTKLSTRGTLSTGQTLDMKLDPSTFTVGLGYRF